MCKINFIIVSLFYLINTQFWFVTSAFPDAGKWTFLFNENNRGVTIRKSLFKESKVVVKVSCEPSDGKKNISISWEISSIACWDNGTPESMDYTDKIVRNYTVDKKISQCECPHHNCELKLSDILSGGSIAKNVQSMGPFSLPVDEDDRKKRSDEKQQQMAVFPQVQPSQARDQPMAVFPEVQPLQLQDQPQPAADTKMKDSNQKSLKEESSSSNVQYLQSIPANWKSPPIFITPEDSFYTLILKINSNDRSSFSAKVDVEMIGKHGYLSAADWPLLPFYGAMCLVYLVMGLAWLIVSFLQWRDLLRIQFWIGGVILLGMLEKAMFYAEYQSINATGQPVPAAMLVAELVSCGKRTLARMLVIIVSLGFGIVKPRLGAMLHRVVGTGILYFILAASVAYIQIIRPKNDPANPLMIANIPVAVLDSAICWWIFTSLVQTTRTLRLRRNVVKLNLYKHFTTTLIFAVFSSIIFMLYSMRFHHITLCATNWNELWVDEAYWRLLFSVILLVIMILWRPTNNNQRYAFTPLLDAPEDDDDEEEEQFINNAYGVKMRAPVSGANSPKQKLSTNSAEEDLKWVEENIPSSLADAALPILDSDEEIMNTRFEISKMQ